jgi:GDP-L-fucose synthase
MGLSGNLAFQRQAMLANLKINENLFGALMNHPPQRVFFAGTAASYAFPYSTLPLNESQFLAGDVHAGEFGYAWAKRMAYPWLRLLGEESGTTWTYGIITNLFGPQDRFLGEFTHVIPALINRAGQISKTDPDAKLKVWGHSSVTRDFLFAPEAAKAILHSLQHAPPHAGQFVNIASGVELSMGRVARAISDNFGLSGVEWVADKPIGVRRRVMDVSKLKEIGFNPSTDFDVQIEKTVTWFKANQDFLR